MSQLGGTRTLAGEQVTEVILSVFRVNGLLLATGDLLTAEHGLTSARWQVLGAVALAQRPLTTPQIARRMGLTRQSVHSTINRLLADGMVELAPNADHRRSPLVSLTRRGRVTFEAVDHMAADWANRLAAELTLSDLDTAARVLGELSARLGTDLDQAHHKPGAEHEP